MIRKTTLIEASQVQKVLHMNGPVGRFLAKRILHWLEIDKLNEECQKEGSAVMAASLVALSDGGRRSFKVEVAPPEGLSHARDIAEKYGVTYDMLLEAGKNG